MSRSAIVACLFASVLAATPLARSQVKLEAELERKPEPKPELKLSARVEDPAPLGVGRTVPDLEFAPITGESCTLSQLLKGNKALVVAMTSVGCPAAMKYIPRLAQLEDQFAAKGVRFVFVNTVAAETEPDMRRVIGDQKLDGPYLADRDSKVAQAFRARTTTEVFVVDASRALVYRGAVDDQHSVGSSLPAPRRTFLRDALEATIVGARPDVGATWSPGCLLELAENPVANAPTPVYADDIARIVGENCVSCHRPGGPGPFGLETYANLVARAPMVQAMVRERLMPPWHGAARNGDEPSPWAHDRSMLQSDRERLLQWLASHRPEGERSTPATDAQPLPAPSSAWQIGQPDLVMTTPAVPIEADGGLRHVRVFAAVPTTPDSGGGPLSDRWVTAVEFRPVEPKLYHHAVVWILEPGAPLPGPNEFPASLQLLGTYSPGDAILRPPPGTARLLKAGSVLVVDQYLTPFGKEMTAALRLGLKFTSAPARRVHSKVLAAPTLDLRPATGPSTLDFEHTLEEDTTFLALTPMMRSRGKAIRVLATLPDGQDLELLNAPKFEFRWQIRFQRLEPLQLPKGTRIQVTGNFDNSENNPSNPTPGFAASAGVREVDEVLAVVLEVGVPAQ